LLIPIRRAQVREDLPDQGLKIDWIWYLITLKIWKISPEETEYLHIRNYRCISMQDEYAIESGFAKKFPVISARMIRRGWILSRYQKERNYRYDHDQSSGGSGTPAIARSIPGPASSTRE
jgi:hypothetical protein